MSMCGELVGHAPLVARTACPVDRRSCRALLGEERIDGMVAHGVDAPAVELRGEALAVPVRQQAHHDDGPLQPGRQLLPRRSAWLLPQGLDATRLVAPAPAMQARPAGTEGEGRGDALAERGADTTDPKSQRGQIFADPWSRRPSATGRQEEEARALLVGMTERTSVWVGAYACHPATLRISLVSCSTNPGN